MGPLTSWDKKSSKKKSNWYPTASPSGGLERPLCSGSGLEQPKYKKDPTTGRDDPGEEQHVPMAKPRAWGTADVCDGCIHWDNQF